MQHDLHEGRQASRRDTSDVTEAVAAGWEALSRGAWDEALELLSGLDDDPEALEGMGTAHWWIDHAEETVS